VLRDEEWHWDLILVLFAFWNCFALVASSVSNNINSIICVYASSLLSIVVLNIGGARSTRQLAVTEML
jgi:hypothetical protein